jgi:hypothetical protein
MVVDREPHLDQQVLPAVLGLAGQRRHPDLGRSEEPCFHALERERQIQEVTDEHVNRMGPKRRPPQGR